MVLSSHQIVLVAERVGHWNLSIVRQLFHFSVEVVSCKGCCFRSQLLILMNFGNLLLVSR